MSNTTNHLQERVLLMGDCSIRGTGDHVVAAMNSLLLRVAAEGLSLTAADIRIRKYYDRNYLRDEILITWDRVND